MMYKTEEEKIKASTLKLIEKIAKHLKEKNDKTINFKKPLELPIKLEKFFISNGIHKKFIKCDTAKVTAINYNVTFCVNDKEKIIKKENFEITYDYINDNNHLGIYNWQCIRNNIISFDKEETCKIIWNYINNKL